MAEHAGGMETQDDDVLMYAMPCVGLPKTGGRLLKRSLNRHRRNEEALRQTNGEVAEVFRRHRSELALGMRKNAVQLANALYARSLISEGTKDWVETARGVSAGDMASRMLSNVEVTLRAAPQALEVITAFFGVIWWAEDALRPEMKKMEEEFQQKGIVVSTDYMRYGRKRTREGGSSEQLTAKNSKQRHQEEQRLWWAEVSVKRDVLEELIVLESKHAIMVLNVSKTFRDDVNDLKFFLASLLENREFNGCDSEGKIFILIQAYISTFNNSVLKITVKRFNKKPALKPIEEYEKEKVQFLKSTTVREFETAIKERPQPERPDDQELIELKIPDRDGTWRDRTLKDLRALVYEVCGMHGRQMVTFSTAGNVLGVHTYTPRNKVEEVIAHVRTKWELLERLGAIVSIAGDVVQQVYPSEREDTPPPDPCPRLKPSIQSWLSKRNETISVLEQLATDIENYIWRNNRAGATFLGAWTVGVAAWVLAVVAAPFSGGTSLVAAGTNTFIAAWFTGVGSWIFGAANGLFSPKVNAAQQAINEDLEESRRLNQMLRDAGQNERVNESDLTLNLREDTPTVDQLRSFANSLRSGRSKADMEKLLNTLQ